MREKAIKFGANRGLVGILTEPATGVPVKAPAIFLNSGILHHVGASRLYVRMARALAAQGHPCFRFDFSGIGDSEARRDTLSAAEAAVVEVREAMDLLAARKTGGDRFILVGLCSGADMAFKAALLDPRVIGLVQLDPFAYRTRGFYVRHYLPKLVKPAAWARFVNVRLDRWKKARRPAERSDAERLEYVAPEYRRIFPPREMVAESLKLLLGRGVQMLHVFSDGQTDHINHASQYEESFREINFGDRLQVEYIPNSLHTFTELGDQEVLLRTIAHWAEGTVDRAGAAILAAEPVIGRVS